MRRALAPVPALSLLGLMALALSVGADVLLLRGGTRLAGRIVSETDSAITILSDGGRVTVARSRVLSVERGPLPANDTAPVEAAVPQAAAAAPARAEGLDREEGAAKPEAAKAEPAAVNPPPRMTDPARLRRAIAGQMDRVGTPGGPTRESLATQLAAMGPDAVPVLVEMLPRLDSVDRLLPAVIAAAASPTPEYLAALAKMTSSEVPERRHVAAVGLGQAGTAADIPRLGRLLLDDVGFVRYSAREALVNIRARHPGPGTTREALRALDGSRGEARREIVVLIAQFDDPAGVAAVEEAADRAEGDERPSVWKALASMSDPRVVAFFRKRIENGAAPERRQAVDALACHRGATAVVPLLIGRLDDEGASVRASAAQHLARIAGRDHGPDAAGWRAWWEQERRAVEERERMRTE